jgi:hypothetical protein
LSNLDRASRLSFFNFFRIADASASLFNEFNRMEREGTDLSFDLVPPTTLSISKRIVKTLWKEKHVQRAFYKNNMDIADLFSVYLTSLILFKDIQRSRQSPFMLSTFLFSEKEFEELVTNLLEKLKIVLDTFSDSSREEMISVAVQSWKDDFLELREAWDAI